MLSFFTRKKTIVVDCFTSLASVYEYTPIVKAFQAVPEWWKKLERLKDISPIREKNMKSCPGIIDLYKRGHILEYWADGRFNINEKDYTYDITVGTPPYSHEKSQFKNGFKNFHHIKLNSPWFFREKSRQSFMFMGCDWSNELLIKILPGVVQFKTVSATNVNIMVPIMEKAWEFELQMGTPLAHIIPLNDDINVKFKNHLVSETELKKIVTVGSITFGGHRQIDKLVARNEKRKKSKCPFNFS